MDQITQISNRIYSTETIVQKLAFWRFKGKKIVFTNGCFDVLHLGHVEYLAKAASLGDVLIIGLNTDDSVRRLKGPTRPVNPEYARAFLLSSLRFVEAVIYFNEDTPYNLIHLVQPDVLVKGDDYSPESIVGYDIVKNKGGEIITIPFVEGFSSTNIIHKLNS